MIPVIILTGLILTIAGLYITLKNVDDMIEEMKEEVKKDIGKKSKE